ncbi:MAG: site-2 protease family protein [Candidatus Merdousia sp.]|nr:site-2 protease family protein [Candidatus Merdousia sp.]
MGEFADIFSNTWAFALVMLFFGGSIFVHELGHFLAARMRGLKILRFSIGFGPKLFSAKGRDGCEYIISLLPFGGYVALPQLADMGALEGGKGGETEKLPKASCADKIIVSAAGAFFNLLFAAALAAIVWAMGIKQSAAMESTTVGFVANEITDVDGNKHESPAKLAGLHEGDKIVSIDGRKVGDFSQIVELVAIGSGRDADGKPAASIEIGRDGKILNVKINPILIKTNISTGDEIRMIGVSPAAPMTVGKIMPNSPAEKAGIKVGDEVVGIDGRRIFSNAQLGAYLDSLKDGATVKLEILRGGAKTEISAKPQRVKLTKSLATLEIPDEKGSVSFMVSNRENPKSDTGLLKVFSVKRGAEVFDKFAVGDTLYALDGREINSLARLEAAVNGAKTRSRLDMLGAQMYDVSMPISAKAEIEPPQTRNMIGYMLAPSTITAHPTIAEQFGDSLSRTYNALSSLVNPKSDVGIKSLAGPVDIGRVIYKLSLTDFALVLSFAVLLNVNLAILNMLPIPVLDGGHILFALLEKLRGKPLPPSFFAAVQGGFSVMLLALMAFVVYNGFMRWSGDSKLESGENSEYYLNEIKF